MCFVVARMYFVLVVNKLFALCKLILLDNSFKKKVLTITWASNQWFVIVLVKLLRWIIDFVSNKIEFIHLHHKPPLPFWIVCARNKANSPPLVSMSLVVYLLFKCRELICWNNKKLNTISCELLILLTRIYFLHLRTSQSECFLYLYWPKLLSNNPLIQSLLNARNSSILSCSPVVNLGFPLIAHVLKTTWFIWKAIRLVHHSSVVSKSHISLLDSGVTTMLD